MIGGFCAKVSHNVDGCCTRKADKVRIDEHDYMDILSCFKDISLDLNIKLSRAI